MVFLVGGSILEILSQLDVLVCVLGFCLQGFVSIASIELLPAFLPELLVYRNMALVVLFCTMVWCMRSSWHIRSRKVAARLSE